MPESRQRKKADYVPPAGAKRTQSAVAKRWIAPAMVTFWLLGLLWIVLYYILPTMWLIGDLGNWNLAIGMVFIAAGFILSTRWE